VRGARAAYARRAWAALLFALGASGCLGGEPEVPPDPALGIELVEDPAVIDFYARAEAFYDRLARRRFDSVETFQDELLRGYFANEEAYSDYYADLAAALVAANVAQSRPIRLSVLELRLEGPGRGRVQAEIVGEDGRPLRPGTVSLQRVDRWERIDGVWRIVPGRG
jgi:hypothetical protein